MKPLLTSPKGKGLQSAYTSADICYNDVNSLAAENSPHLASPVGEGLIHQDIDSPSTYRVTSISPTGENERGLM